MYLHRASWKSSGTLTEVFPVLFLQLYGKCQDRPRKDAAQTAIFQTFCVVLCTVRFMSFCVLCAV